MSKRLKYSARPEITPAAIAAFRKIKELEAACSCLPRNWEKYWEHEPCASCEARATQWAKLRAELHLPPWQWPPVQNPDARNPYPAGSRAAAGWKPYPAAQELWRILEEAGAESD
jgi:hypothetical protein